MEGRTSEAYDGRMENFQFGVVWPFISDGCGREGSILEAYPEAPK